MTASARLAYYDPIMSMIHDTWRTFFAAQMEQPYFVALRDAVAADRAKSSLPSAQPAGAPTPPRWSAACARRAAT